MTVFYLYTGYDSPFVPALKSEVDCDKAEKVKGVIVCINIPFYWLIGFNSRCDAMPSCQSEFTKGCH